MLDNRLGHRGGKEKAYTNMMQDQKNLNKWLVNLTIKSLKFLHSKNYHEQSQKINSNLGEHGNSCHPRAGIFNVFFCKEISLYQ